MLPDDEGRWAHDEIGPALGQKVDALCNAASVNRDFIKVNDSFFQGAVIARAIGMAQGQWSYAQSGHARKDGRRDTISARHLRRLATYFRLDDVRYVGRSAWELFKPDVTIDEFRRKLLACGYREPSLGGGNEFISPRSLLRWFSQHCECRPEELELLRPWELEPPDQEAQRAAGFVDQASEREESRRWRFKPREELIIRLPEGVHGHFCLLQLCESDEKPHTSLVCMAPSYRQRSTQITANRLIPTVPDSQGHVGFPLGEDAGKFDLLVFVASNAELLLPFSIPAEPKFHSIDLVDEWPRWQTAIQIHSPTLTLFHARIRVVPA